LCMFFFFQAEDGIRDRNVTGVQTCALPIWERRVLLLGLIILLLIVMKIVGAAGLTSGNFNSDYLAGSLINFVPMALLALAELFVILSGRGSIDLSVGSIVSVVGLVVGLLFAEVGLSLVVSLIAAVLLGDRKSVV